MSYKAKAPGSLMLLGEYGVLYGEHALVCALDKYIHVTLTPRKDDKIHITSMYGEYETSLTELKISEPYQFVLQVFIEYQTKLKRGCDLIIESEFSDKIGFGSSAAVTVATIKAIVSWLGIKTSSLELLRKGRNVIRMLQGVGSGADIAASIYGGVVSYQAKPLKAEKISVAHPIVAVYSGSKTKTAVAINRVQDQFASHTILFKQLTQSIGQCAFVGAQLARQQEWKKLGEVFNIQQGLMESLGVSNSLLHEMIESLRAQKNILGAKISGSGFGDCIIGLGEASTFQFGKKEVELIPVNMTLQGVTCEKI